MKLLLTMNLPYTRIFGGANKSNKSLAEEFAGKGHDVEVLAPALATPSHITHEQLLQELTAAGIKVREEEGYYRFELNGVKINAVIDAVQLRNKLIKKIQQYQPDWVLISAEDPSQTLLNAAHEAAPDKIIYLAHTPQMFPFGPESMYPGEKRTQVIGKSRLIVTISEFVAKYIKDHSGFDAFVNHPPHFGTGPYPNLADFEKGYVLTMNPCSVKGIKIFTALAKAFPRVPFAVVPGWGTTPSDKKELEAIPNVTFLKNEPELDDLLKNAKILLMPTLWSEGFGMAAVDAMLRGIPVVASNHGGLTEAKLGTPYLINVNPVKKFRDQLDENSLPVPVIEEQDLTPWKQALEELCTDRKIYMQQSALAHERSHAFINSLSVDKLEKWLLENLPGAADDKKSKINIKDLSPEQKKKLLLELQKKKAQKESALVIKPVEKQDSYELSYAQKRLWILDQINEGYYGYIIPTSLLLEGTLNKKALSEAFSSVIRRHESLRTYFVSEEGQPRQKIKDEITFTLEEFDFSSSEDAPETTRIFAREFGRRVFDLSKSPLLRAALVKLSEQEHILLFAMHHIISDGWSMKVLTAEVYASYIAIDAGKKMELVPLPVHYKDYGAWQNENIENNQNSALKKYWYNKLSGEITVLNLPTDKPRPAVKTYNGKLLRKNVDRAEISKIEKFCGENRISIFSYLTAAVKILLHRYTGQSDIIVGTPTAGRNNSQLENQIGFYVNMLALRDEIKSTDSVGAVLQNVHQTVLEALEHEAYPYDKIVDDLDQQRDLSRSPLFDIMVSLDEAETNNGAVAETNDAALSASPFNIEEEELGSSHDLAFLFSKSGTSLSVNFVYNTDLFEDWKAEQILAHISTLVNTLFQSAEQKTKELEYLSEAEKQFLLEQPVKIRWPEKKLVHELFEDAAVKYSTRKALSFEGKEITYKELNERSNKLAHFLRKAGVGRNTIVAMLLGRSENIIINILAILKAGGTYLPIDPDYPKDRIEYTLTDSKAEFLVADEQYEVLAGYKGKLIFSKEADRFPATNLPLINGPDDIAYIIYTSGSTGWPKGVMIHHYNVVRLLFNDQSQFDFNEQDIWTLFHSCCFDFSVWEMYGALLFGGKLIIVPKLIAQSPREFWKLVNEEQVTVLNQTPGAFYNLLEEAKIQPVETVTIRYVIFGGEALNPKKLKFWNEKYPASKLINMYGITETTVHVTYKEITGSEIQKGTSNIGKPIPTLQTYILDADQNLLPLGVAGELCVGGLGLAKGYLNRSELTEQKFIINPFQNDQKLYRSGDLAKMLPGGEMEYLGRIDFQVKIRGFRIELGEIEAKLNTFPGIEDVLVIAGKDESEENFLCAYYVAAQAAEVSALREHLGKDLPDYMIPSFFIHYHSFPLNQNGKVDRKALADPLAKRAALKRENTALPENETQKKLAELWNEVLNISASGIDDNFFESGGHSLKANQLIGKIYRIFQAEIRLGEFFDAPTIRELAAIIDTKTKKVQPEIPKISHQSHYELSYAQQRMWILDQMEPSGAIYTMPMAFEISGALEIKALEYSVNQLVKRHESLRTTFNIVNGKPVQIVNSFSEFSLDVKKVTDEELNAELDKNAKRTFDLKNGPLAFFQLLNNGGDKHAFLFNMHHIISDGASMSIVFKEIFETYAAYLKNKNVGIPELKIQYRDFASWQNEQISEAQATSLKAYWHDKMSGEIANLSLPADLKRPEIRSFSGNNFSFSFSEEKGKILNELAKQHNTSMFVVLLSLLKVFISKISNEKDIIIGSPVSGRVHPDLEEQIGFYVNTLAFRDHIDAADTFSDVIVKVSKTVRDGIDHQIYPFDRLVGELDLQRDLSRNPLFDIMISMDEENDSLQNVMDEHSQDISISPLFSEHVVAKFDLIIGFHRRQSDHLAVSINYNTDIFREETIRRFSQQIQLLTDQLITDPSLQMQELNLLSEKTAAELIASLSEKEKNYSPQESIIDVFEKIVHLYPEKIAIQYNEKQITYRELNKKADVLAAHLVRNGIEAKEVIGIIQEKSVDLYISMLAILKAGAAYLPVDPNTPQQRIGFMLNDCACRLVLTDRKNERSLNGFPAICVDELDLSGDPQKIHRASSVEDLAYIIYTSGSTGMPKGVLIKHKGVLRLVLNNNFVDLNPDDTLLQLSNYSFDGSVFDIFGALLNGGKLSVIDNELVLNPSAFGAFLVENKISVMFLTTALFNTLVQTNLSALRGLRKILFGGEKVSVSHVARAFRALGPGRILHVYGPTETTVFATFYPVNAVDPECITIPIGKPVSSTAAYVLDERMKLQPVGTSGELYLGGDGLAKGYLNAKELDAEKFVSDPFNPGALLYKTGDLVRVNNDLDIEYIDRIDSQVKIRGFRIELGEIEAKLRELKEIKDALAIVREDQSGQKSICAYYTSAQKISVSDVKAELKKSIPDFMIPAFLMQVESIPLNKNGKVDKSKLPDPLNTQIAAEDLKQASDKTEELLVEIWKKILGISHVGVNQNFFDLGGQSLKAALFVNELQERTGVTLKISDLFQSPAIEELAKKIKSADKNNYEEIAPAPAQEFYALSSAQKRLFILDQFEGIGTTYNMPGALKLAGKLDPEQMQRSLQLLVGRHESLRTSFKMVNDQPVQIISNVNVQLDIEKCKADQVAQKLQDFVQPFDLSSAPLFRMKLLKISDTEHALLYDIHHIICDGFSMELILRELFVLYNGEQLPELKLQYKDFAHWQRSLDMERQKEFWLSVYKDEIPELNLPLDYKRSSIAGFEGGHVSFELNEEQTGKLKALARENNLSMYMLLFSFYSIVLSKLTGRNDIVIGTPVAGRDRKELENIIGMFVNNLAIRLAIDEDLTVADFLANAKNKILAAFDHQDFQFEDLVNSLDIPRELGKNPLFDTIFTFQAKALDNGSSKNTIDVSAMGADIKTSKFDLTLAAAETENTLQFIFEYSKGLFREESIRKLAGLFAFVVEQVLQQPGVKIKEISCLTENDRQAISVFNKTGRSWPENNLVDAFKNQVPRYPENIALRDDEKELTYAELDALSDRLAKRLVEKGIEKGDVVSILLNRSANAMIAMLGVMKAGACYLPIDVSHPEDRIRYYISDSGSKAVISTANFDTVHSSVLTVDELLKTVRKKITLPDILPQQHAYMIYTSGSTGNPKGVKIRHESIVNTIFSQIEAFEIDPGDAYLQFASLSFDASVMETYGALLAGATLAVPSENVKKDLDLLVDYCNANKITAALLPPSLLALIDERKLKTFKTIISGGEAAKVEDARRFSQHFNFFNAYGPTEVAVSCTMYKVTDELADKVAIGKPLYNTEIYLLDKNGSQVPVGSVGEICVAGVGVAEAYHNRPELSAEKFIRNKFSAYPVLYRTGDLGKLNSDGNLEYEGRVDEQIKINGYRIELGEIENNIRRFENVRDCFVKVHGETNRQLIAYYVSENELDLQEIKTALGKNLPSYMVPAVYIRIDKLPMTVGGKVNSKMLPLPEIKNNSERIGPLSHVQKVMFAYWAEVLETKDFGITDNFFQLGGNSMSALKLVSKMSKDFVIRVNQLFENPTIEKLEPVIAYQPDNIKIKLNQLKSLVEYEIGNSRQPGKEKIAYLRNELTQYRKNYLEQQAELIKKPYDNILLTGGLGFLGVHLVREILLNSQSQVLLLLRNKDWKSGKERFKEQVDYYFPSEALYEKFEDRISYLDGDITKESLGINEKELENIDCILHSAANTSHFGEWADFIRINIEGTRNVINFAKRTGNCPIHYISTLSVASGKSSKPYEFFSEESVELNQGHTNYYLQSKIEAEKLLQAAAKELKISVYRVGNLMPTWNNGVFQKNAKDNAFMNTLKFYLDLKKIPDFKPKIYDFSFVDKVAHSIHLLMNIDSKKMNVFHITNPNKINDVELGNMIAHYWKTFTVKPVVTIIDEFIDNIDKPEYSNVLEEYIANSKVLEGGDQTKFYASSEKTNYILKKLNYTWEKPDGEYFKKLLIHLEKTGFITDKNKN